MIEYTKTYFELKTLFDSNENEIIIPSSGIKIKMNNFSSDVESIDLLNKGDSGFPENNNFSYPVFTPEDTSSNKVILLLHGLNERSWVKYLVWAYWLAKNTESYVILFPISFHINRSPESWKDPREMSRFMKFRNSTVGSIEMSSFANIALSNRLTESPLRFFNSGYQTTTDITKLLSTIKSGQHPVIPESSNINIFAYSIGAFLAEIILMGNPEGLLSKSKLFIFCGGSVFSNMKGSSKLIMDSLAFQKIYDYYLNEFEETVKGHSPLSDFLKFSQIGMAFRSMIDLGRLKSFRENILNKLKNQIRTITLTNDKVIPSAGVVATLRARKVNSSVEVWDFPYDYSHENPFPIMSPQFRDTVDQCFEKVFREAKHFFAEP